MKFLGTNLSLSVKLIKRASTDIIVEKITKEMYDNDNSPETLEGRAREAIALKLVLLLEGVEEAWLGEAGSGLDSGLKTDIAIRTKDNTCLLLQVKSSEASANAHLTKQGKYEGKYYPVPPVVWFKEFNKPRALLLTLSTGLGLPIASDVIEAIQLASKLKGRTLPAKMLKLSTKQLQALHTLGYTRVHLGDIVFN